MTLNKKISLISGTVVLAAFIGLAVSQNAARQQYSYSPAPAPADATATPASPVKTPSSTGTTPVSTAKTYTLADVAKHPDATSCWTAINGGVYDVTSWINQHPGGPEAILSICGKDGSSAFNAQHGGQTRPANELAGFKIGTFVQ